MISDHLPDLHSLSIFRSRHYFKPSDIVTRRAAAALTTPDTAVRGLFSEHTFISADPTDKAALLMEAMPQCAAADVVLTQLRRDRRSASAEEQALIDTAEAAREVLIQVFSIYYSPFTIHQSLFTMRVHLRAESMTDPIMLLLLTLSGSVVASVTPTSVTLPTSLVPVIMGDSLPCVPCVEYRPILTLLVLFRPLPLQLVTYDLSLLMYRLIRFPDSGRNSTRTRVGIPGADPHYAAGARAKSWWSSEGNLPPQLLHLRLAKFEDIPRELLAHMMHVSMISLGCYLGFFLVRNVGKMYSFSEKKIFKLNKSLQTTPKASLARHLIMLSYNTVKNNEPSHRINVPAPERRERWKSRLLHTVRKAKRSHLCFCLVASHHFGKSLPGSVGAARHTDHLALAAGGAGVLTTHAVAPVVANTTVSSDLLVSLNVLSNLANKNIHHTLM